MELTIEEKQQYSRHLILDEIGITGQTKIKEARVLVIGAGGLGCPVLQYLTAAGVGTIGIIDNDVVAPSNLQRQILYTHEDIDKNKAQCATRRLQKLNPFITFNTYQERLTNNNALDLVGQYHIIVDGSDNFSTRYLINDAAVLQNKPVVFGSIFKFDGQVSIFNYNEGPTYRCLFPLPPEHGKVPNCSEAGVIGVLPAVIGALQANEVLKIICGMGDLLSGKLLTFNMLTMEQQLYSFKKNLNIHIEQLEKDYGYLCNLSNEPEGITLQQIKKYPDRYHLLDVREAHERALHHIGGQHIPLGALQHKINQVSQYKELVVYCKSGVRSKKAIQLLRENNFHCKLLYLKDMIL